MSIPDGWNRNPSTWRHRLPYMVLSILGLSIATYLSLYQLHLIKHVFEPFFGSGSRYVLTKTPIEHYLPVPDGLLGAIAYLVEVALGSFGGEDRWRAHPRIVLSFALVACGLGGIGTLLTLLQGAWFDHWCTLCLCSAFVSINLVGPALEEALASLQYLTQPRVRQARTVRRHP